MTEGTGLNSEDPQDMPCLHMGHSIVGDCCQRHQDSHSRQSPLSPTLEGTPGPWPRCSPAQRGAAVPQQVAQLVPVQPQHKQRCGGPAGGLAILVRLVLRHSCSSLSIPGGAAAAIGLCSSCMAALPASLQCLLWHLLQADWQMSPTGSVWVQAPSAMREPPPRRSCLLQGHA